MTVTYSLAVTGVSAGSPFQVADLKVPDTTDIAATDVIGTFPASQGRVMSHNSQVLCKNPDGSQSWYTIDAERSVPGGTLVMKAV